MRPRTFLLLTVLALTTFSAIKEGAAQEYQPPPAQIDQNILAVIFSGDEMLRYAVTWGGGVKIGDIKMTIQRDSTKADIFNISAHITDAGPLKMLYPVNDTFACLVSGPMKLPYQYTVHQKEGFGREIHRFTRYDQANHLVWYRKNKQDEQRIEITGPTYNEFAAFVITRSLAFTEGESIIVPTFADKKRHEVKVTVVGKEKRRTRFGSKNTLVVQPQMPFKGLYEKSGNTTLWLTDDRCRIPLEIHSKIVIGSLVAELVGYTNPACPDFTRTLSDEQIQ
ncbi:MAG: DUF3108 domain-containing protein [Desulfobulbus oligotrophicus]|jgi:hypothetical protein|nr:DUF3108 domain-containing protein [Desulfobulbus oligotrophicus]